MKDIVFVHMIHFFLLHSLHWHCKATLFGKQHLFTSTSKFRDQNVVTALASLKNLPEFHEQKFLSSYISGRKILRSAIACSW
jgi:hypothetical protein